MKKLKKVTIYTDGAAIDNPGPGGYGVVLLYHDYRKELSGGFRHTTNNRMEIMACIVGLSALKFPCSVVLYSDSKYVVDGMAKGWARRWRAQGWYRNEKEKAKNIDLWRQLLDQCEKHRVEFRWVKGHAGNSDNERCDELAVAAAARSDLPPDAPYENGETRIASPSLFSQTEPDSSSAPTAEQGEVSTELGGKKYIWTGTLWYESTTYLKPPLAIIRRLNKRLSQELAHVDAKISNTYLLLQRARKAREAKQHHRAEKLARQCLALEPDNPAALAVLCASLRAKGTPEKALKETQAYSHLSHLPLLTSRAAALCDLRRWEEAKRTIGRVLAMGSNEEGSLVVRRIKAARPDLYDQTD